MAKLEIKDEFAIDFLLWEVELIRCSWCGSIMENGKQWTTKWSCDLSTFCYDCCEGYYEELEHHYLKTNPKAMD